MTITPPDSPDRGDPADAYRLDRLPDASLIAELERLAISAAVQAGRYIRDERPDSLGVAATKSSDLDIVTAMDTGSERLLREVLERHRPQDAILGEEDGATPGRTGLTWVLDPIDGTVNYLYDLPAYAVSVAVVVGDPTTDGAWRPVAAAVINPRTAEVFHAGLGSGAWRRGVQVLADGTLGEPGPASALTVNPPVPLEQSLVGTGFSYDRDRRRVQGQVAAGMVLAARDLRRMGAAALDLCAVAAGQLDGYYEGGLAVWDLAGGALILIEAGGSISGLADVDSPPGPAMVIAAGAEQFPALHDLVSRLHREVARDLSKEREKERGHGASSEY